MLTVPRGAALYVGALIGPGLLFVPGLAAQVAGPASLLAWALLLIMSAPIASTFARLGARYPGPDGVSGYVRAAFGGAAAAVCGAWFVTAVLIGGPAVALIGGFYVADLTGGGRSAAVGVGLALFLVVMSANLVGLRLSSTLQLGLSAVLVATIVVAVALALPAGTTTAWHPFAPHGWAAVGSAANLLIWLIIGWEAMAQLAGQFRHPARDLPRAVVLAYVVIVVLYAGLAVTTVSVTSGRGSSVPLADLLAVGMGEFGRRATTVLALVLTAGTMNVYVASASRLTAALAAGGSLPRVLAADQHRDVPRRPLAVLAVVGVGLLAALGAGLASPSTLVQATSACFVSVYLIALAAAARLLTGASRAWAVVSMLLVTGVAVFSAGFLLVPLAAGVLTCAVTAVAVRGPRQGERAIDPSVSGH